MMNFSLMLVCASFLLAAERWVHVAMIVVRLKSHHIWPIIFFKDQEKQCQTVGRSAGISAGYHFYLTSFWKRDKLWV
jgi:hypothetical protein